MRLLALLHTFLPLSILIFYPWRFDGVHSTQPLNDLHDGLDVLNYYPLYLASCASGSSMDVCYDGYPCFFFVRDVSLGLAFQIDRTWDRIYCRSVYE